MANYQINSFEWDESNNKKNYQKHGITHNQAEETFLDENLQIIDDIEHSQQEKRFVAIGKNFEKNIMFVIFTIRNNKIRIISARIANKKERMAYD